MPQYENYQYFLVRKKKHLILWYTQIPMYAKKVVHHVHSADAQTDLGKHILQKHTDSTVLPHIPL